MSLNEKLRYTKGIASGREFQALLSSDYLDPITQRMIARKRLRATTIVAALLSPTQVSSDELLGTMNLLQMIQAADDVIDDATFTSFSQTDDLRTYARSPICQQSPWNIFWNEPLLVFLLLNKSKYNYT